MTSSRGIIILISILVARNFWISPLFGLTAKCVTLYLMYCHLVCLLLVDDGISGDPQKHVACNNSMLVQSDLRSSGWKPAQSKCYWEPCQIGEWLGFLINTIRVQSDHNTQLKRFNSKFWCPGTEAIDCFTQNWSHCNNWVCLPPALILSVLKHMAFWKASGVFLLCPNGSLPLFALQFVPILLCLLLLLRGFIISLQISMFLYQVLVH